MALTGMSGLVRIGFVCICGDGGAAMLPNGLKFEVRTQQMCASAHMRLGARLPAS